jgi:hypothetical protein
MGGTTTLGGATKATLVKLTHAQPPKKGSADSKSTARRFRRRKDQSAGPEAMASCREGLVSI